MFTIYIYIIMMSYTYSNLNYNFTFQNICLSLEQFWVKEVKALNYSKIWLTITVTSNKKSYLLINNLPFNTADYPDIVIVLKQALESSPLDNKAYMESITFKFYSEKPKSSILNKLIFIGLLYTILLLIILFICFILFIIYLEFISQLDNGTISKEILDQSLNIVSNITHDKTINISNNRCSFLGTFLQYFSKSPSNIAYYPSYFLPSNLNPTENDFNLLEYILYRQYGILDIYSTIYKEYIEGLSSFLEEYQKITTRI